jgi:phage tail-like protein
MATGKRVDPFRSYNFAIEIEGLVAGGFSEVSGLEVDIETQDYREGGVNGFIHKRAGPAKYPSNLTLKRGVTDNEVLWNWYWNVVQGMIERKNVSVLLMDQAGQERLRWNFEKAYPVKWVGPDMRAGNSDLAIESMELAHKGLMSGGMLVVSALQASIAFPVMAANLSVSVGAAATADLSVNVALPTVSVDVSI